jgi:hypothetical protein
MCLIRARRAVHKRRYPGQYKIQLDEPPDTVPDHGRRLVAIRSRRDKNQEHVSEGVPSAFITMPDLCSDVADTRLQGPDGVSGSGVVATKSPAVPRADLTVHGYERRVMVVMVGLPARGKSYISKMLIRYLRWASCDAKIFNVGELRRRLGMAGVDKSFFDSHNEDAKK